MMCLLTIAYKQRADYPLIIIENRDEAYERPSENLTLFDDGPQKILAGKDLQAGGMWFGIREDTAFAVLINHPFTDFLPTKKESRGRLVKDFLENSYSIDEYITGLQKKRDYFESYHLVLSDGKRIVTYHHHSNEVYEHEAGIFSLTNTYDDLSKFKKERSKVKVEEYLTSDAEVTVEGLIKIFQDSKVADDIEDYPGELSYELAEAGSAMFIVGEEFGTVNTTAMLLDSDGQLEAREVRYFANGGGILGETDHALKTKI